MYAPADRCRHRMLLYPHHHHSLPASVQHPASLSITGIKSCCSCYSSIHQHLLHSNAHGILEECLMTSAAGGRNQALRLTVMLTNIWYRPYYGPMLAGRHWSIIGTKPDFDGSRAAECPPQQLQYDIVSMICEVQSEQPRQRLLICGTGRIAHKTPLTL